MRQTIGWWEGGNAEARDFAARERNEMTTHPELTAEQRNWFETAAAMIDVERMRRLNREITAIHSPTGRERAASE